MTALESFNALDNREVSRKEVEQVLAQAKAENNTAIIYRLSRVLNDSPEATHFEITITHYDSPVGLSGVQHTGDYREALDDCGRLKKGWKFVKGNVIKVEKKEKPKKEAKPKKEKAPQKEETTKEVSDPKVKDFEAFDDLQAQLLAENADIPESEVLDFLYNFTDAFEEGKTVFRFWNTPGKKPTEAVLQYKKHPLLTRLQNPSAKMRAYELTPRGYELLEKFHKGVERIKKTYDLGYIAGIHKLYNFLRDRKANVKKEEVKEEKATSKRLQILENSLKKKEEKFNEKLSELYSDVKSANGQPLNDKSNGKSTMARWNKKDNALRTLNKEIERTKEAIEREQFKINRVETVNEFIPAPILELVEKGVLNQWRKHPDRFFVEGVEKGRIIFDRKKGELLNQYYNSIPTQEQKEKFKKVFNTLKEELAKIPSEERTAYVRETKKREREDRLNYLNKEIENVLERIEKFESKSKENKEFAKKIKELSEAEAEALRNKMPNASEEWWYIPDVLYYRRLQQQLRDLNENVEDSSKKKVEKAPAKATKSLKSRKEKGENAANFTLLQEPTKVFLEFEDEKNQAYYKNSADKQGAVGADFLKKVIKDLKKQNLREEPRGFINTEDFPVSPTISKVTGIDSLKTVVVKDKNRPTLECVLIEADRYVATDLYNIILLNRSKNDGLKTGALYDPNYKCTKIGGCSKQEYYRDIERGYLNYKAVLTENPVYTSDWVAIEPIIQHLKSGLEVIRKIYDWKKVYVVKITSNVGEGHYNLKHLLNDLQILQSNGAKKIRLYTNKLDEKLNIETDNGNIVVTMAVYMGDRSNYADVISPLRIAPVQLHFTQNRKEEKGLSGVDYSQGLFGAVPEVSTERFKTLKEAKRFFLKWALEHLRGKKIYHKELKKYVVFNRTGIEHSLSSKISYDKLKLITQAKKMLKESHLIGFEEEYKGRENIAGVYRMKATAILDEEKVGVILTLREGENGVIYYDHKIEAIERNAVPPREGRAQSFCGDSVSSKATSIPAPSVTERLRDSSLSEGKGTKKSLSRKKKEENFGLNASEAPVTSLTVPRQTLAQQLATRPEVRESFLVADEQMSLFLGALEKKTKDSLVITLTGKQGSGKTRFAFQFMNALAQRYRVGHASIEEHPESVLYEEKAYQYLNDTALEHITAQDVRSLADLDTMIRTNEVIVIDSFQKMRELAPNFEVDKDLRKKYDGKLFLVIFQQTADGKMRGGSKSQFDGDIILFTETFPNYRENYVYPDKNRYNKRPATELQYSIYEQRMLATAPEEPALPAHYEPTESEELNFEVL